MTKLKRRNRDLESQRARWKAKVASLNKQMSEENSNHAKEVALLISDLEDERENIEQIIDNHSSEMDKLSCSFQESMNQKEMELNDIKRRMHSDRKAVNKVSFFFLLHH